MCPMMVAPPQKEIMADENTHGLLIFNSKEKIETLVLEPAFHGNAKDFGMVMPTPSRPELLEADENLFTELWELTNPVVVRGPFGVASSLGKSEGIKIIEVKDVGDFTATVLTADDTLSLIKWLEDNNYVFKPGDVENFEYYVEKGGYFFVVLKVNIEKAKVDEKGNINGKLSPIEFVFESERPMLPIRVMRSDMEIMSFTLYTLSDSPYYIPGTKVMFSRKLSAFDFDTAPTLKKYSGAGDWLVRTNVRFDFIKIGQDLFLEKGSSDLVVEDPREFKIVNPHLLSKDTGIVLDEGSIMYLDVKKTKSENSIFSTQDVLLMFSLGLLLGVFITLLIVLINAVRKR